MSMLMKLVMKARAIKIKNICESIKRFLNLEDIYPSENNRYFYPYKRLDNKLCMDCNIAITPTIDGHCPLCAGGVIIDIPRQSKQILIQNLS